MRKTDAASARRLWVWGALLVTAALFYALNVLTPLFADDYSYLHSFVTPGVVHRLEGLHDLYLSQLAHYRTMNGRTVAHVLAQSYLMLGKPLFNVINTLVFVLLGLGIYYAAFGTWRGLRPVPLLAGYALLWFSMLKFGQSCLWLVGSCNYMHSALFALAFLLPYRSDREGKGGRGRALLRAAAMLPAGVIAGWTNESTGVMLLCCAVLFCARRLLLGRRLSLWMLTGLLGALAGFCMLLFSPGQAVRTAGVGGLGGLALWLSRVPGITFYAALDLCLPGVIGLALLGRSIRQGRGAGFLPWLKKHSVAVVWLFGAGVSVYCMVAAPYFPLRAWCTPSVTAACAVLAAAGSVGLPRLGRGWQRALLCVACVACLWSYADGVKDIDHTRRCDLQREADILSQKAAGVSDVSACALYGYSRYNAYSTEGDLVQDSAEWQNLVLQMYYEVGSVNLRPGQYPG